MANFVEERVRRFFKSGSTIFKENDYGSSMYIIQSGEVEVSTTKNNQKVILAKLGKGSVFGEMALVEQPYRSATVTAVNDVSCIEINKVLFNQNMQAIPAWMRSFYQILVERLRESNKRQDTYGSNEKSKQIVIMLSELFQTPKSVRDNKKALLWQETIEKLEITLNIPAVFIEKVINRLILVKLVKRDVEFKTGRLITLDDEAHFYKFADYCTQELFRKTGHDNNDSYKSLSHQETVVLNFIGKLISEQAGGTDLALEFMEAKCNELLGHPLSQLEPVIKIITKKGIITKRIEETACFYDVNKSRYRDAMTRDNINKSFKEYEVIIGKD